MTGAAPRRSRARAPSPTTQRKAAARAALAEALAHEKRVKATRVVQARELRASCKQRRAELTDTRKRKDAELREEKKRRVAELRAAYDQRIRDYGADVRRLRAMLAIACTPDRAGKQLELRQLRAAVERAREERNAAIAAAKKPARGGVRGLNIAERQAHEIAEAQAEFDAPWEKALLESLARRRKIKKTPRRSLAESFNEWLTENAGDAVEFMDEYYQRERPGYEREQRERYELEESLRAARGSWDDGREYDFGGL